MPKGGRGRPPHKIEEKLVQFKRSITVKITVKMELPPPAIDHPDYLVHYRWMGQAIELAQAAGEAGEIPVGAIVVQGDRIIATAENRRERDYDPTAHAEILALRQAGQQLGSWHLESCVLYVTLEPCPMCAGAILQARLGLLVYGADDPKAGAIRTVANLPDSACSFHRLPVLGGILELPCRQQLQNWFSQRRQTQAQHRRRENQPENQPEN